MDPVGGVLNVTPDARDPRVTTAGTPCTAPPAAIVEGAPLAAIVEGGEGGIRTSQAPLEMRLSLIVDLRNHPESLIFNKKR